MISKNEDVKVEQKVDKQDAIMNLVNAESTAEGAGEDKDYYIPASDKKGQARHTQFRQQPLWYNVVETLIASKEFPFKTQSAFYRYAVVQTLLHLQKERGLPDKTQGLLCKGLAIDTIVKDEEIRNIMDEALLSSVTYIHKRMKSGDITGAKKLYTAVITQIEQIHDKREKKIYLDKMKRQFKGFADMKPASLDPEHFGVDFELEEEPSNDSN
jgi:hypothetical protein